MLFAHRSIFKFLVDQVLQQQDCNQGFAGALDLSTRLFCVWIKKINQCQAPL